MRYQGDRPWLQHAPTGGRNCAGCMTCLGALAGKTGLSAHWAEGESPNHRKASTSLGYGSYWLGMQSVLAFHFSVKHTEHSKNAATSLYRTTKSFQHAADMCSNGGGNGQDQMMCNASCIPCANLGQQLVTSHVLRNAAELS